MGDVEKFQVDGIGVGGWVEHLGFCRRR
jgi:hypothetical protein